MMTFTTVKSLEELKNQDLDLIISTRFDINFKQNPFEVYDYDFTKCSFLWREPEFIDLPIVNDTFIVFPYHMLLHTRWHAGILLLRSLAAAAMINVF